VPLLDKICDAWDVEQALVSILVKRKGRVNKRSLSRLVKEETGKEISTSSLVRKLKDLKVEVKRRRYAPLLTPVHKLTRYYYGAKWADERYRFWIDLDEKWFYCVRIKGFVWILPEYMSRKMIKRLPVQSKRYITKVMFLTAVARPIFAEDGSLVWDGKVGNWRVADIMTYKRGSGKNKFKKYKKGDKYVKDVNMGAEKYVQMMKELLLPRVTEIKEKYWDPLATKAYHIRIQHDGAPGHRANGIERDLDAAFRRVNASFVRQPPKSPCSNMLDMAVFNSLAAAVAQVDYEKKDELEAAVHAAWRALDPNMLERLWACKCITMRQFVFYRGEEFSAAHTGLRVQAAKSRAALWAHVEAVMRGDVSLPPLGEQ